MKYWCIFFIMLLFLPVALAVGEDSQLDKAFAATSTNEVFIPPIIVDDEQKIYMNLIASDTQQLMVPHHLEYELFNPSNDDSVKYLFYIEEGVISLSSSFEDYLLILKADIVGSPGKDYYGEARVSANSSVFLFPIGSVRGEIVNAAGESVRNADVKLSCVTGYGDTEMLKSDDFGSFRADWLPLGSCKIYAMKGKSVGSADIEITHGDLVDVEIVLNKNLEVESYFKIIVGVLIFLLVIIIMIIHFQKNKQLVKKKEIKLDLNQRTKDIMKTLNEKEHQVVSYLLEKDCEVNQANIRYEFRIPKTTLSRLLESLERKKIIIIKKFGKAKKICLTDFFLGKEETER